VHPLRDDRLLLARGEETAAAADLGAGELYFRSCRRERAGEAALAGIDDDTPNQARLKIRAQARIEFEIKRDPDRQDNRIAKACGTSTVAVRKARVRLGLTSPDPA
jgi:hypothetical protein